MPNRPVRALVAVDSGLDAEAISDALPTESDIQVIGVVDGLDEGWKTLQDSSVDLSSSPAPATPTGRCS